MRKLSAKERLLLGALGVSLLALWRGLPGDVGRAGRSAGGSGTESIEVGDPPIVPLELLGAVAAPYDRTGRNLFEYHERRPPFRPATPRKPMVEEPQPAPPTVSPSRPAQPAPPRPAFAYIGYFGPKRDLIAVFVKGSEVLLARTGDVVDGQYRLLELRYDSVVLGRVGEGDHDVHVRLTAAAS